MNNLLKTITIISLLAISTNVFAANQDAIDYLNSQSINYADLDYYSYDIKGCNIKINLKHSNNMNETTKYLVNAKNLNWALTGRDMRYTEAYPSGDLYAHSLVCTESKECINVIGDADSDYSSKESRTFSIVRNPQLGERMNQAFIALIKSCGGSGRGF